jgi:hypothetical protein
MGVSTVRSELTKTAFTYDQERKFQAMAMTLQSYLSKNGVLQQSWHIYRVVCVAYEIVPFYRDISLSENELAKHLIIFAMKETLFNTGTVGTHGERYICQTMTKDIMRLLKKARGRGLALVKDTGSIKTGLALCAEEFKEKIDLSGGDTEMAAWKYNGRKEYGTKYKKLYKLLEDFK